MKKSQKMFGTPAVALVLPYDPRPIQVTVEVPMAAVGQRPALEQGAGESLGQFLNAQG